MPPRVHLLLSPDLCGLARPAITLLPSPRRAPPPPSAPRGSTPRAGSTAARDEHLRQLATLSVARPVAVMVTRDRRHAAMIPARPRPFHAARHVSRPFLNDEHPQLGDDAEDRAGHRTVERVDEHGPEPVPEEERELREDYPGDEDRSANRPAVGSESPAGCD